MILDNLIHALPGLSGSLAADVLSDLRLALDADADLTPEQMIVAAYVAGVEDALTNTMGRPEHDLRLMDLTRLANGTLSQTGRAIAAETMRDIIAQAQADVR
jgi:hypothetical protein